MRSAGSVLLPRHNYTNILLKVAFVVVVHFDADFVPLQPPPAKWSSCTDAPPHLYSLSSSSHLRFPSAPGWFLSETQSNVQCCYKHQDERLELCSKHTSITLCFVFFSSPAVFVLKILFFPASLRNVLMLFVVALLHVWSASRLDYIHAHQYSAAIVSVPGGEIKDCWKA